MTDSKKPTDTTATSRQRRRRENIKKQQGRLIQVALTKDEGDHLDQLLDAGYAPDQRSVVVKALDEAYEREVEKKGEADD